jgi:hypothetical protein
LYGTDLLPDKGLSGASMPGAANTPQAFSWDAVNGCFTADGIPIVPKDDAGKKNFYPMMRLKASRVWPFGGGLRRRLGTSPRPSPRSGWRNP